MSDLQQEQRLGKYTIVSELGRGGFATVYLARDTVLRRSVALKVLHPILLTDPAFVTRFESEARAIAQFEHPHIATIYELGHYEGRLCIAIQLLPGGALADRIRQHGPLSFADAVRAIGDVAEALDHAHAAGFIHRDVKPSNILFNARGEAVLTDFGLVKAAESSVIARTTMGGLLGTPPYMAPEVWEGKGDSPRTDVYALGCVLYEMLTGELLFKGDTPPAVMLAHFQPHKFPASWPAGTPLGITDVLERALAVAPIDRYASAGALAADLRALATPPADPLAAPYQALQAALAVREWERASALGQEILARNPNYRDTPALARQAAAAQEQARRIAEWRDTALAAERTGMTDAARAVARLWLELAPDDAEARALLARLDAVGARERETVVRHVEVPPSQAAGPTLARPAATTERRAELPAPKSKSALLPGPQSTKTAAWVMWASLGLIVVGWATSGWMGVTLMMGPLGRGELILIIAIMIGVGGGGLVTGVALRRAEPSLRWRDVWMIASGWAISGLLYFLPFFLQRGLPFFLLFTLLSALLGGPLATALVMRKVQPAFRWRQILATLGGWVIGAALGLWLLSSGRIGYASDAMQGAILGGVFGAIGGGVMLWQIYRASRSAKREAQ